MTRTRNASRGFTLIEMMVSLTIVGLLASIAVPQYQTYATCAQVTRVVAEVAALRIAVEGCVIDGRITGLGAGALQCDPGATGSSLMALPSVNGAAPTLGTLPPRTGVPEVFFPSSGSHVVLVRATFGNAAAAVLAGQTVTWQRNAMGAWSCTSSVAERFKSAHCS